MTQLMQNEPSARRVLGLLPVSDIRPKQPTCIDLHTALISERTLLVREGTDARMSGDTILAIIAVSLTAIFISIFAIECDRDVAAVPGIPVEGDRSELGLAAGKASPSQPLCAQTAVNPVKLAVADQGWL
jgi:hypothetical protein